MCQCHGVREATSAALPNLLYLLTFITRSDQESAPGAPPPWQIICDPHSRCDARRPSGVPRGGRFPSAPPPVIHPRGPPDRVREFDPLPFRSPKKLGDLAPTLH